MGSEANGLVVRGWRRPGAIGEDYGGHRDDRPPRREAEDVIREMIADQNRRIFGGVGRMTETNELKCEFCGMNFDRPQGLGSHRARCKKNPQRKEWNPRRSIERAMERAVESDMTIVELRRRLVEAIEAEIERLQRELTVLKG